MLTSGRRSSRLTETSGHSCSRQLDGVSVDSSLFRDRSFQLFKLFRHLISCSVFADEGIAQ